MLNGFDDGVTVKTGNKHFPLMVLFCVTTLVFSPAIVPAAHWRAGCLNSFSVGHSLVLLLLDLQLFFPKDAFQLNLRVSQNSRQPTESK